MKYRLKKDVFWYKKGTIFEKLDGNFYITEPNCDRCQTLDGLQMEIINHMDDEGGEELFELLETIPSKQEELDNYEEIEEVNLQKDWEERVKENEVTGMILLDLSIPTLEDKINQLIRNQKKDHKLLVKLLNEKR